MNGVGDNGGDEKQPESKGEGIRGKAALGEGRYKCNEECASSVHCDGYRFFYPHSLYLAI
jgi:hypothetical protein